MRLETLPTGDPVHRYRKCIAVPFTGPRRVLSTCALNGGYREDLTAVFNNDMKAGKGMECRMLGDTYEEHLTAVAEQLGLDPGLSAGMSTAAGMENAAIRTERCGKTAVTAVVTGGIDVNGGRAGDPASWDEAEEADAPVKAGTINIMLFFNTDLTPGALARALVTCTEAKTAALQELLAPSRYSMGIATGSGTDSTILVSNAGSSVCLTNAGKHAKLGELIGRAVKAAVKEALRLETGLSPESQHDVLRRTDRFGITEDTLWEVYRRQGGTMSRADFADRLERESRSGELVAPVSLYAHLLDQLQWGLLPPEEAVSAGRNVLEMLDYRPETAGDGETVRQGGAGKPGALPDMIRDLERALAARICGIQERSDAK